MFSVCQAIAAIFYFSVDLQLTLPVKGDADPWFLRVFILFHEFDVHAICIAFLWNGIFLAEIP